MVGIDARVVLGLAAKMGAVFVDEGAYQAFPLAPIGLKADSLRALVADEFGTGAAAHAQFSLLVNQLPTGELWRPRGPTLWDVYGEVLSSAELLEKPLKPRQQKAYDKAFALLYDDSEVPGPSETVVAYERYRDAYLAEAMEYNNRKGEASLASADPAVQAAWEADEPGLRAEVEEAARAWAGPGHRAAVDDARRVLSDLGSTSPQVAWASYRKLFDPALPEIFFRTSADGLTYLPTSYMPTDVADVAWPRITVSADELGTLAESAPDDLRSRLGDSHDSGVSMVSFEYSYVTVSRPWFTPQVFASEGWRFRDPSRMLSDGGSPPTGECTAYVTGLVLARNITVTYTTAPEDGERVPDLGFLPSLTLMRAAELPSLRIEEAPEPPPDRLKMVVLDDPAVWATRVSLAGLTAVATAAQPAAGAAVAAAPPAVGTTEAPGIGQRLHLATAFTSLRKSALVVRPLEPTPAPAGSGTSTTETATAPDEVYVLALQCRRLPRCPAAARPDDGATPRTYVVARGDTLAKIARTFYRDPDQWPRIFEANRQTIGDDPNAIEIGWRLTIP